MLFLSILVSFVLHIMVWFGLYFCARLGTPWPAATSQQVVVFVLALLVNMGGLISVSFLP